MDNDKFINAIKNGNNALISEYLLVKPSLIDSRTETGISAILLAMYLKHNDIANLLANRKSKFDIFEASALGRISDILRCTEENPELVNSYSPDGFTPLGLAAYFCRPEAVNYLMFKGANVNLPSKNTLAASPLHYAASSGNFEIAFSLIDSGANVNVKQVHGVTPLHSAAHIGHVSLVNLLIENGADLFATLDSGETPLDLAYEAKHSEIVEVLKEEMEK
jgi:uncharacterized protein